MDYFCDLRIFQENNVNHTPPSNAISDKYFNIKFEFDHVLQLCYAENVYLPCHTVNLSCMILRNLILYDDKDRSRFVHSMLSSTGLPLESIEDMVSDRIFLYGWRMERDPMNLDYKVLTMAINITVVTPYDDRQEIDQAISESISSAMTRFTPASKDAIQSLEKMRFDHNDDQCKCMICLEEFSIGVETMQMPCGHSYHEECIVKWLETSHVCPLCRYEMPCVCVDTI